jgi:hypothetical protein
MTESTSPAPAVFAQTLAAAADLTGTSPQWLLDLIVSGAIPCAFRATGRMTTSFWISPVDIRRILTGGGDTGDERIPIKVSTDQEKIIQVRRMVRTMIETREPSTQAADAISRKTALITKDRRGQLWFSVRADDVVDFSRLRRGHPYTTLASIVTWALERTGAERVRGIRGIGDEGKTWGYWWRLPATLATPAATDDGSWRLDILPAAPSADEDVEAADPLLLSGPVNI